MSGAPHAEEEVVLTKEMIDKMNVQTIRRHLRDRNLSVSGRKSILEARLKEAVANGAALVQYMTKDERQNMGGERFAPMVRWELVEPDSEVINEEGLEWAPTVSKGEARDKGPKKKNDSDSFYRPVLGRRCFFQNVMSELGKSN